MGLLSSPAALAARLTKQVAQRDADAEARAAVTAVKAAAAAAAAARAALDADEDDDDDDDDVSPDGDVGGLGGGGMGGPIVSCVGTLRGDAARRDDDDGGVFSGRTESTRESITLPDLLKRGTKKEDRESAAYEYSLGDADEASHPGWGRPSSVDVRRRPEIEENRRKNRVPSSVTGWGRPASVDEDRRSKRIAGRIASPPASLAGDAHPPSAKTGDRGESNLQSWSIEDPMARAIGGGCASASTWKGKTGGAREGKCSPTLELERMGTEQRKRTDTCSLV